MLCMPLHTTPPKAAVPKLFGTRNWFRGRQFFHGWGWEADGSGGNESDGGAADEAPLACLLLPPAVQPDTGPQPWGWGPLT